MKPPHGRDAIVQTFGDCADDEFERNHIVSFDLPFPLIYDSVLVRRTRCHHLMVPVFVAALNDLQKEGLAPVVRTYGGIYANRLIRGGNRPSTHAWGISIDLNPRENALGTFGKMPPGVLAVMGRHGFLWGGMFKRKDPMHFQFCTGY